MNSTTTNDVQQDTRFKSLARFMFVFVLILVPIIGTFKSVTVANGLLCWSVMTLMLVTLNGDEAHYHVRLSESIANGEMISFKLGKRSWVLNLDYFKLACEKAFEWTYITMLFLTGMHHLMYGYGLSDSYTFIYEMGDTTAALAGFVWSLPALFYYSHKRNIFKWISNSNN